jgi:hypothetical protein
MAETGTELRRLGTSRTAVSGYAAGTGVPAPRSSFNSVG